MYKNFLAPDTHIPRIATYFEFSSNAKKQEVVIKTYATTQFMENKGEKMIHTIPIYCTLLDYVSNSNVVNLMLNFISSSVKQ